jgi:hypothetical protein
MLTARLSRGAGMLLVAMGRGGAQFIGALDCVGEIQRRGKADFMGRRKLLLSREAFLPIF